ncbi:hypothetical protein RHGRI_023900 [Rhododendron griersonianum]|uniref:DNA helicase n=1 Tax=Rhododendron griersonianum TaxID=479676 RepID=A0AAV6J7I9_9ERIC|nr:hypothetical protein RHGRI_023900 [Rhododendron griersonianum]
MKQWSSKVSAYQRLGLSFLSNVIAAANPIGGRYDSSKTFSQNAELTDPIVSLFDILYVLKDIVDPIKDEMLAKFVVDSHFKSQPEGANKEDKSGTDFQDEFDPSAMPLDTDILPQDLLKKYITYAKFNVVPSLHDADLNKLQEVYAELRRESSRDFNELILHLLRGLVKDPLHFEEIISGSTLNLSHIDVKLEELQSKALDYEITDLKPFFSSTLFSRGNFELDEEPFFSSTLFSRGNFELDEERGLIRHHLSR